MLHIFFLLRSQVQLHNESCDTFFLNISKVREYFVSSGIEFHIWLHPFMGNHVWKMFHPLILDLNPEIF